MRVVSRLGRARASVGLIILLVASTQSLAATNVWQGTFGQNWFYEIRSWSGEVLAGTWWESSLTPGTTYTISFNVQSLRGSMGLLVGNNSQVSIDKTGTYSFDFNISEGGKRRMIFRTLSRDTIATVNRISVAPKWTSGESRAGGSNWVPPGHYLSFDRERNLKTQMQDLVDQPWTAPSRFDLGLAENLDAALETAGVKGVWMEFEWRRLEMADGQYDWRVLDANVDVARQRGLKFIVKVADRSFSSNNVLPTYFPADKVLWYSAGGKKGVIAKRWDPYVYNRLIRLHKAIANRYAGNAGFGGIATAETAMSGFSGGNYSLAAYQAALTQVITQTQAALKTGKLFLYLNFLRGGDNSDMNKDGRVSLLRQVPHSLLAIGAPDTTPDVKGMPRSATNYRIHARKHMPDIQQFCHLQHVDQGLAGRNAKNNFYRQQYLDEVAAVREREKQPWFKGQPAVFEFDDLRDPNDNRVKLHPNWVLGNLWTPSELFHFGQRNFGCDYVFWHYREFPAAGEFGWQDVRPVILSNQYF